MKKISRKDLQGLRRQFPVLTKDDMRHYVGGYSNGYSGGGFGNDWFYHGFGGYDPDGNFHWYSGYTQEELDNWEGSWPGGWVYGLGYVAPDTNIYGSYPGFGNYNGQGYFGWGYDNSNWWDYGYSSGNYGSYTDTGGTDCVARAIVDMLASLGVHASLNEVSQFIDGKYGCGGVPGHLYYTVLDHYFNGSPTPIPPYGFNAYTNGGGSKLLAVIGRPEGGVAHAVTIIDIEKGGTGVTYYDNQNGGYHFCTTLDIRYLYRVDSAKNNNRQ